MKASVTQRLAKDVLERAGDDVDTLRHLVDLLDRRLSASPLERTMRLWDLSRADLGRMFGVSRQAIGPGPGAGHFVRLCFASRPIASLRG